MFIYSLCNSHWEEWSKYKNNREKNKQTKKTRERWRLISLSFTKTMWDLQVTGERDVLYTALMPQNEKIQRQYLRHASTTVRNWPHIHQVMMTEWRRTQKHCRQINWHYYQRTSNNINSVWQTSGVPRATWTKITSANCGPRCKFSTTKKKNPKQKTKEEDWERQSNVYSSEWISDFVFLKS